MYSGQRFYRMNRVIKENEEMKINWSLLDKSFDNVFMNRFIIY